MWLSHCVSSCCQKETHPFDEASLLFFASFLLIHTNNKNQNWPLVWVHNIFFVIFIKFKHRWSNTSLGGLMVLTWIYFHKILQGSIYKLFFALEIFCKKNDITKQFLFIFQIENYATRSKSSALAWQTPTSRCN